VAAGALAFVISLSGILGIYFVGDMTSEVTEKQEILKYALPTRSFNDALSGASVDLPNGWVMLPPINPITNIPEAHMIAAHPESGSFAALEIVRTVEGSELNEVLSRVVADLQKRDPTTVESERVNIQFGRLDGRKVILEWEYKGARVKGALTVARNGHYYFLLHEWCMAESFAKSRVQFAALESGASAGEPTPNQFSETHGQTY